MDRTTQRRLATLGRRIEDLISEGAVEDAVKVLTESLDATRRVRRRDGSGPVAYEDVPDWPARLAAAKTLIEFRHGKPRQSIQMSTDDEAGRKKGRDEVMAALTADWERTKRIGDSWLSGMKRAEEPASTEVQGLVDVDID